ncbi:hypothetical protein M5X06_32015 [Paenibacillus alvei]|uniref:Lipoprotein n=1 Tax=Paenibacillus alvei TaxID=44250 RepID=A0ABT4H991_PAEAL|nr:hypothetical protein [Paenibacillus alvei]MCY7485424.1 hypothetical protein [Paenibacillus alvei]MCY9765186.1 hypothetical protein [Paenibacillus alvei]MCY9771402.1 hypothetical protein [Paenibacillus alvei]
MKKILFVFLIATFFLSGCGDNTSSRESEKIYLIAESDYYITRAKEDSYSPKEQIESLRKLAKTVKEPYKELYIKLADLMEKGNLEAIKDFHEKLEEEK